MRTTRLLLALLTFLLPAAAGAQDLVQDFVEAYGQDTPQTAPVPEAYLMGPVALVGHGRIGAEQVLELWTPVWSETQAKVRNGKMDPREGDAKLHVEWEKALRALIKEELFFQEAEREHSSMVNGLIDRMMRGGADRPRSQMAAEVRRLVQQDIDKHLRMLAAEVIKESGGRVKLHKVLESRGLTFMEWQNRLKKRAFSQSYLHMILKPRAPNPGPRQIQQYYSSNPDEFSRPGVVKFRHIFLSNSLRGEERARDDAVEAWERLVDGEIGFDAAVAEYSDDPESKARGGLETEAEASDPEREAWLADIRAALREETPDEIGPILESPFGCHVAVLLSIGPPQRVPFQEVRREIEAKLAGKIWEEETDRYFAEIRKATDIRILHSSFPPQMSCSAQAGVSRRQPRVVNTARPEILSPRGGRR